LELWGSAKIPSPKDAHYGFGAGSRRLILRWTSTKSRIGEEVYGAAYAEGPRRDGSRIMANTVLTKVQGKVAERRIIGLEHPFDVDGRAEEGGHKGML